jgi:hypothetical protein
MSGRRLVPRSAYDTEFSGDFPLEGGCIGPHKTRVDAGNVKVRIQDR